jgi:peptidoglycan/LPS O-acetylase OafA/YrhL
MSRRREQFDSPALREAREIPIAGLAGSPAQQRPAADVRAPAKSVAAHRADIDGLRTVAVLPVVAFHVGVHVLRGGFVGVDVFFVISGFLITQMIADQLEVGRFSILSFYERRIRRILPALLAVLLAVYLTGLVYFLPADVIDLSKSLIAAALSGSNVYFWFGAGYFDRMAISKPLLHTWSLAVEEQFYMVWPIMLMLGYRFFRRQVFTAMLALSILSLAASAIGAYEFPIATFYLPFTRFWELSIGGLLALGAVPRALGAIARNVLAAVGLALIAGSVLVIDPLMPFPGLLALPPCVGAAMILLAGRDGDSLVGRLLSLRPMVFIGLISYSLYLWHWPITVFQRNCVFLMGGLTEFQTKLLIIGASMAAASLSWKFIETPFRSGTLRPSAGRLFKMAAAGTATIILLGMVAWSAAGFPARFSPRELRAASFVGYDSRIEFRFGKCFLSDPLKEWRLDPGCLTLSPTKKNLLLLGDSHAADLWYGLSVAFADKNFLQVTAAACLPTVSHKVTEVAKCTAIMDGVYQDFLVHRHVDQVLLSAKWTAGSMDSVRETLHWMAQRHIHVTVFGPTAVYDSPVPRLLVSAMRLSDPDLPQHHRDEALKALDVQMRALAKSEGADYISMLDLLCTGDSCLLEDDAGLPLIYDGEHFTKGGSVFVAERLTGFAMDW